jgi:phosphoribosylformylglycinamidine synthase
MPKPKVLVLRAPGSNCDHETAQAWQYVGAEAELVHVNRLIRGEVNLLDYQILTIPGGFAYGDDLGAGTLLAKDFVYRFRDSLEGFLSRQRPILGICNGFQALVKTGLIPGATLYANDSGRCECRWVHLEGVNRGRCIWTAGLEQRLYLPVAHAEGKFVPESEEELSAMFREDRVVFTYVGRDGNPSQYPDNPNGSLGDVAGLCDSTGTIFGMMPHPERHILRQQHPRWTRGEGAAEGDGAAIFRNGLEYVS